MSEDNASLRRELDAMKTDLSNYRHGLNDVQIAVNGTANAPQFGLSSRMSSAEKRLDNAQGIIDRLDRERAEKEEKEAEQRKKDERKQDFRHRVYVAMITTLGALMVGIVLLLLQIQAGVS